MNTFEIINLCIALLALILSLALALREVWKSRLKIDIDNAVITVIKTRYFVCYLRLTASNKSSTPISIYSCAMVDANGKEYRHSPYKVNFVKITTKGISENIESIEMPVVIQPYESRSIELVYRLTEESARNLNLPPPTPIRPAPNPQTQLDPARDDISGESEVLQKHDLTLNLYTPRKVVRACVTAKIWSCGELLFESGLF